MNLSSAENIPTVLEHVSQGADVLLTKIDPLSDATDRFEDLQFAIDFSDWRVINYLQFQEAVDLDKGLLAILQALFHLKGAGINSAAEAEALCKLYAAAKKLEELCDWGADDEERHALTARSPSVRTISLPVMLSAFGVDDAAPDTRSLLLEKLVNELEVVRGGPFPLEFVRFNGLLSVSDMCHVLTATKPRTNARSSLRTKILISGARLGEATEMLQIAEKNAEVAGWDISEPVSSWEKDGWEIYTATSFEKLRRLSRVDYYLRRLKGIFSALCAVEWNTFSQAPWFDMQCKMAAQRLMEAHAHEPDFAVLDLPGVAQNIRRVGRVMIYHWDFDVPRKPQRGFLREGMDIIASVRKGQVNFTLE